MSLDRVLFNVETKHFVTGSYKSMMKFQKGGLGCPCTSSKACQNSHTALYQVLPAFMGMVCDPRIVTVIVHNYKLS